MATKKKVAAKKSTKKSSSKNIVEKKAPFMQFMSNTPIESKKESVAKKKVSKKTAKKVVEKVVAPAKTKRYFMVEIGGRGGEIIVGTSTKEFVEYWKDRDGELSDHLSSLVEVSDHEEYSPDDEDFEYPEYYDKDSPTVNGKKIKPYFDYDDVEHDTGVSVDDHSYTVTEIELDPNVEYTKFGELSWKDSANDDDDFDEYSSEKFTEIKNVGEFASFNTTLYYREIIIEDDKSKVDEPIPVVMMYDSQKGTFGRVYVETNGEDFDPNKFTVGVLQVNADEIIMEIFYDKKSCPMDTDCLNTWGKGFFATVGYMEKDYLKFNRKAWIKEGWKELGL